MSAGRRLGVALLCCTISSGAGIAQTVAGDARVTALIGLARTARDQGRAGAAVTYFRDADRLQPFAGALLVEYFWAAHAAGAPAAAELGRRVLGANPRDARVRDGLIGLAAAAGDEARVGRLADEGRTIEPSSALWPRRLGESYLRSGKYTAAAQQFLAASMAANAESGDRAWWALALELSGDKSGAARAWAELPAALWSQRPDWTESRARALAPPAVVAARSVPPPPLTPVEIEVEHRRRLARQPCELEPLRALQALPDGSAFVDAVAARPADCGGHAEWTSRAVERLIADGSFERAIALARPAATRPASPVSVREQLGVLLHWTGAAADAEPILRRVVEEDPAQARAATALIELLRARGDSDAAWAWADRVWRQSGEAEPRIGLAELALETGRVAEALGLATALEHDDLVGERAVAVEGAALLRLGRAAEARRVLEPLVPAPAASLLWLDAVAASEGLSQALAAAGRLPVAGTRAWADVNARRAVWEAQLGHRAEAARWLEAVAAVDPLRGQLTAAEIALATGTPIDAEAAMREVLASRPAEVRAQDGLSTALAEQGRWDEALAVISALRERRPSEHRWAIREAEWRYRQSPSPETLRGLETAVSAHPHADGPSALARAYFHGGQFDRVVATLGDVTESPDYDRVLLARSLRAMGRAAGALAVLRGRDTPTAEARLLAAQLESAVNGYAAAARVFEELTAREDADPDWFLAWVDLSTNAADGLQVLQRAAARFPQHAVIEERLAVAAWARRDRESAARAAALALEADPSRTAAWFVQIELTGGSPQRGTHLAPLLDRFEAQFPVESAARVGMAEMLAGLPQSPDDPATARALGWMDQILERDARHAPAAVARARLLAARGDLAAALAGGDTLIAARAELPAALKLRAELLGAGRRYTDAVAAYDRYLAVAPDDLAARRQQARVEGWRGAYDTSRQRYAELRQQQEPEAAVVAAEADAKDAFYSGRWTDAAQRYDRWLSLDPDDVEARLERAQLYDRLGNPQQAVEGFRAVTTSVAPNDVAVTAAERIERRRQASVDFFANGTSADAAERQQLLDLVDSGAGVSDDLGLGYATRGRLFGGPSWADGEGGLWRGHHVGMQMSTSVAAPLRVSGAVAYRKLETLDAAWWGDFGVIWRLNPRLRISAGVERAPLLENASTLAAGTSGVGPTAAVRWTPGIDFTLAISGSQQSLSDDNGRRALRVSAAQRVLRGTHEIRLVGMTEGLAYREERPSYFTPASVWRVDGGFEWRGWLAMPSFFGDRERWVSAGYTLGADDRSVRYHTGRLGLSYELASGVALVADAQATRSAVYNAGRVSIGLRLRQVAIPEP